jgi:hypothetical protein
VAKPAVGLVAAGVVAVNPLWYQSSGILMSESVYLIAVPLLLLVAISCIDRPTPRRFLTLGIVIALAVLIRSEAIDFVILLGLPVLFLAFMPWRRRLMCAAVFIGGLALVLGPWLIRNEIQLGGTVLSTNGGVTLAGSYCPTTFDPHSSAYGSFDVLCAFGAAGLLELHSRPPGGASNWSELAINNTLTTESKQFALHNLGKLPGVVLAREESVWGFGNQQYQLRVAISEGRNRTNEEAGRILYWALLPFAALGAIVLAARSRKRFLVLAIPIVVVAVNAAVFYGSTRMRSAAEPTLAIFAAAGIVQIASWTGQRSHGSKIV